MVLDPSIRLGLGLTALALLSVSCVAEVGDPEPSRGTPIDPGPASAEALPAPSDLKAFPHEGGIHLTWADHAGDRATAIEIERKGTDFAKLVSLVFGSVQYHDGDVLPGGTYTYRVRAVGEGGASSYSNQASATSDPGEPGADAGSPPIEADAGSGSADSGAGRADGGTLDAGTRTVSFRSDIVPIFNRSCGAANSMCHSRVAYAGAPNAGCRGWLALEDMALGSTNPNTGAATGCPDRSLYDRITQLQTWMCTPMRPYVQGGNLRRSHLYQVIAGDPTEAGTCDKAPNVPMENMPPVTQTAFTISPADVQAIAEWINAGAPNN